MTFQTKSHAPKMSPAAIYLQVLSALILRDMRTRFGGSHVGFIVAVMWPVVHVFVLLLVFTFRHLPSPMGCGTALFIATGAVPCLVFQYISREVMKGYSSNKPLIFYPQVKLFDVILSRVIVEIVSGFMGLMMVMGALAISGLDPFPIDVFGAISAYLAAIFLGIGMGVINVGIVAFFPGWNFGYVFLVIVNYILAGVTFMPSYLPSEIYYYLRFNPVLQIVEWMRNSYEPELGLQIDFTYIFLWISCTLILGLLLERFVVKKLA